MAESSANSSVMLTTRKVASLVWLNKVWQAKYRRRAKELSESPFSLNHHFTVCIVGRCGVGKRSLINHLLGQNVARIAHNVSSVPDKERVLEIHGFRVREIPGYDGKHTLNNKQKRRWWKSRLGSQDGRLELEDFIKVHSLFEENTNAIIFVINNRITEDDRKFMSLAIGSGKFFCVVQTHGDSLNRIHDTNLQQERLENLEQEIRKELLLVTDLHVRIFIISIPWPSKNTNVGLTLEGTDTQGMLYNCRCLQFPLLQSYLKEPKGLRNELQIHAFVKEEVWKVLSSFETVRKRYQVLEFLEQLVAGLLPVVGPSILTFTKTLYYIITACADMGLIQDLDNAIKEIENLLSLNIASKEAMKTAVSEFLMTIFTNVIEEIVKEELVVSIAEDMVLDSIFPVAGSMMAAIELPRRYKKIAKKLAVKACMLHQLWVMQNISQLVCVTN